MTCGQGADQTQATNIVGSTFAPADVVEQLPHIEDALGNLVTNVTSPSGTG